MSSKFEDNLRALCEEQNTKNLFKLLNCIRKEVDWPRNKQNIMSIRTDSYLKHFVKILQSQHHKHVIDVCLSIIGNCAMDRTCAREMFGAYNIISSINHVLKRFPKEDSINGRVFRILGNLLHHETEWANVIINRKPQIVTHLTDLLLTCSNESKTKDKHSEATVLMAIRTLRYLINQSTVKLLIQKHQALSAVGALFIKFSKEWLKDQSNDQVLNAIVNLLYIFSRYKDYSMVLELKSTDKGNALEKLTDVLLLCPKKVIKIIMNLIRISRFKSDLPVRDICNKFMLEISNKHIESNEFNSECLDYVKCLCFLLDHPANRNDQQCCKAIPLLIGIFGKLNTNTEAELQCCILIVNTLNKCQYEESLIQEQLKCNILDVLVDRMRELVDDSDITNKHTFKKGLKRKPSPLLSRYLLEGEVENVCGRKRSCTCGSCSYNWSLLYSSSITALPQSICEESRQRQGQLSPVSSDDEFSYTNYSRFDRSPSPCSSSNSDYAGLSWTSPTSSPQSLNNEMYSDSDDYSPVCSEADCNEFPLNAQVEVEGSEASDRNSECGEVEENLQFDDGLEESNAGSLKMKLILEMIKLIKSYAKIQPPIMQLGSENLLLALLNCSEFFTTHVNPACIVCDILHSHVYLIPLMKTSFIEKVYGLTEFLHTNYCSICGNRSYIGKMVLNRLTVLAEGAAGKGDIAHELLRGADEVKRQIALVVPYIIENRSILSKLLLDCGGLSILMQLLQEDAEVKKRTIKVLCALASKKLKIANPKKVTIDIKNRTSDSNVEKSDYPVNVVTFKLDDGTRVTANRTFLTEKSVYFSSLLSGHFKESAENEVNLHNVKFETLRCLMQLLGCLKPLEKADIDTLLDVVVLSDRYLMNDICCDVTNYIEKHKISAKTVPVIYKWSMESGLDFLRVESVAFALVASVVDDVRYVMFKELFELGYAEELTDDIHKLLVRYLSCTSLR